MLCSIGGHCRIFLLWWWEVWMGLKVSVSVLWPRKESVVYRRLIDFQWARLQREGRITKLQTAPKKTSPLLQTTTYSTTTTAENNTGWFISTVRCSYSQSIQGSSSSIHPSSTFRFDCSNLFNMALTDWTRPKWKSRKVDESGWEWKWMKVDESGRKWMKVNENKRRATYISDVVFSPFSMVFNSSF